MLRRRAASSSIGSIALALGLLLGGCHDPGASTEDPTGGGSAATEGGDGSAVQPTFWSRPGASHTSNIDLVAITSDGTAVLTRDQIGGMRLWPALDGSEEPVVIPVQGPQQFSLAARADGGFMVAAVDSAGGARIHAVREGGVTELGTLEPFHPLFGIYALPGGERLLALFRDHTIQLMDATGATQATFEERRFRPTSLRLSVDGKTFAAIMGSAGTPGTSEVQRLRLVEGKGAPRIERLGSPRAIEATTPLSDATAAMSPGAERFVAVDEPSSSGSGWMLTVTDLTTEGAPKRVEVPMPAHVVPSLGFVSTHEVLVSGNDGSLSWLVDLDDSSLHARTSAPQDFVNQGRAQAQAGGVQVVGHGTWLFVHRIDDRSHRYLGYRSFQTQSVAVSPSGTTVAWAYQAGPVFVETLGGSSGQRVALPSEPSFGTSKVRFIDDDHVVTIDGAGGIHLYRWRDATLVDEAGVHGAIRALHFEPDHGVMLVERHNNDARLYEVSAKGFAGPYIVADQSFRAGLLAKGTPSHPDAIMWTLDSGNRMRHYSLEELRSDPSQEVVMAKGQAIAVGKVAPLAVDRYGRHYGVRWNGSTMEIFVDFGQELVTKVSASGDISAIVPSPAGTRFVAIHQRGQSTSLSVHDSKSLDERWSFATGVFNNEVVWSPDGRFVAVAANTGAVVLDADTGEPVQRRCGIEFAAMGAPPASAFNSLNLRSMCET